MIKTKFASRLLSGLLACSILGSFALTASAATGDIAVGEEGQAVYDTNRVKTAAGVTRINDDPITHEPVILNDGQYRMMSPGAPDQHYIYGLETKGLDGTKAYTIVVEARAEDMDPESTDDQATVFGIDPKIRKTADASDASSQDPVDVAFSVANIKAAASKADADGFVSYYLKITPKNQGYEGVDKINLENRLTFNGMGGDQYYRIYIRSIYVLEGEVDLPNGVTNTPAVTENPEDEDEISKDDIDAYKNKDDDAGKSVYNQYASYKGSNKDFVNRNYDGTKYADLDEVTQEWVTLDAEGNVIATVTKNSDADKPVDTAANNDTDTDTDTPVDTDTSETIVSPVTGRGGITLAVVALVAALAVGTTVIIRKKRG